jgi:lauroyl/myristoyl acyltransferase
MRTIVRDQLPAELPEGVELVPKGKMPPAPLRVRLGTSTLLRRAIPTPLVLARAERKAHRRWRNDPGAREHALQTMRAIVTGTPREDELEELAERRLVEAEAWSALFWQPWPTPRIEGVSRQRLLDAYGAERGVILSGAHVGPFFNVGQGLDALGVVQYVVMGDWYYEAPSHDQWGRFTARWRIGLPAMPVVRKRGGYAILAELLRQGLLTTIYFDLPGPHETRFLGKPVMLVDGTARLACETDAVVLPQRVSREGTQIRVEYCEPLDPRDFDGPDDLHEALARVHERLILDEPADMQDPAITGWDDCARPEGWSRPARPPREGGGPG